MSSALLTQIAIFAIPVILAITLHEAAHGYVALHFGDTTAKNAGRITLNPLAHVDPLGTIILPLLLILSHAGFVFGWAKPVPVNFAALKNPRWNMIWVAAAGPAMNLALAAVSTFALYAVTNLSGIALSGLNDALTVSIEINLVLAVFNMLPIPPLDGSKILAPLLPAALARPFLGLERFGMTLLLVLLVAVPIVTEQMGGSFDLFVALVQRPAEFLMHGLLSVVGLN
jgi:Zn-dependent protease